MAVIYDIHYLNYKTVVSCHVRVIIPISHSDNLFTYYAYTQLTRACFTVLKRRGGYNTYISVL